jgi:hypothetical protein
LVIREPLPGRAAHAAWGAVYVADAERNPVVVPELVLGEITVKMLLGAMLVHAAHPRFPSAVLV